MKDYRVVCQGVGCGGVFIGDAVGGCRGVMECKGAWRRVGCGACFWWRCEDVRGVRECKGAWRRLGCGCVFFGGDVGM